MQEPVWPAGFATERLQIRPIGPDDRAFHAALYADHDVMRHVGPTLGQDEAGRVLDRFMAASAHGGGLARLWIVQHTAPGARLGLMSVRSGGNETTAELGLLFSTMSQGRGYAAEAVNGLLSRTRPFGGRLRVQHREGNERIDALMRRLCFVDDGVSRGFHWWTSP